MILTTKGIKFTEAGSRLNSKPCWSKTAGVALNRQEPEQNRSRLNQTDLLYIFNFFILSTWELSKYTTLDVSSRLCIFRYLFLLSMCTVHCSCIYFPSFISHSCFIKINNQVSSGNSFTKLHPERVASSIKQTKDSTVSVIVWEQWSPTLDQVAVAADVSASPFNWHFGPFPVRGRSVDRAEMSLSWPKVKETALRINTDGPGVVVTGLLLLALCRN